ncbi:MAG: glycine/sarcosine/betaine reductase selenoprotein B family protein [Thermodesulfobacteriota bacterium]|jgi:D-proline reductase (dithiol) PrdB
MSNLLSQTRDALRKKYPGFEYATFRDAPITALRRPLAESTLALVTTGGLHLKTDPPFDTRHPEGDCSYRVLPTDVRHEDIAVSHESYDHRFINEDLSCVFPIDRMREYVREGRIGALSEEHVSFMGHISVTGLLLENARKVGRRLRELSADAAFLTPT